LQINLFLRVERRREDGYHDLASLFHVRLSLDVIQRGHSGASSAPKKLFKHTSSPFPITLSQVIDLGDNMDFGLLPEGASSEMLRCSDPSVPINDSNLVIKV